MPERILILNVSGIGDFIESTPTLRHIRQLYPESRITLAVAEKVFALAARCPYVDDVVALPTSAGRSIPKWKDVPRWIGRIWPLRGRFDRAINLYRIASKAGGLWIRLLLSWSRARIRVESGGVTVKDRTGPELWIAGNVLQTTREWLQSLDGEPVAIFLGGERRTRHEDPKRAEVWLKDIQTRWGIHPIIIGSRSDPGLPEATNIRHTDMRGKTDLEHTAAIIACSRALITTHSAPQHFAGVWNVPTVVLVGPGDDELYHPQLPSDRVRMFRHPVPCAPCYHNDCPLPGVQNKKCMTGITPAAIVEGFGEIFSNAVTR
jgi:ADP-heptose:LPS heptosyltransferase